MAKKSPPKPKVIQHHPEGYIQITEANRKFAIKTGRTLFVFKPSHKGYDELGYYFCRPRLLSGWMKINGKSVSITEDEDRQGYIDTFNSLNNHWIKLGWLYFSPDKELIKYEQPKQK